MAGRFELGAHMPAQESRAADDEGPQACLPGCTGRRHPGSVPSARPGGQCRACDRPAFVIRCIAVGALIGIVGLGKLGLPIALTLAWRGHSVLAYDVDPARMGWSALSPKERGPDGSGLLADHEAHGMPVTFCGLDEVAQRADCIFIVVETPHGPLYEGVTPLPSSRADFAYGPLLKAVGEVCSRARSGTEIGVMSTVLPGTMRSRVLPLANGRPLVYCPQFVAMGTVARDMCNPEFALIGRDRADPVIIPELLSSFGAPVFTVSYESAELAKVMYNTFVSAKVTLSNVVQRMAYETGANAHDV